MSHHGNQKFSSAPVIHAMASTISSCLPNLKLLYPFSSLVNFDRFCEVNPNSPPIDARSSNGSSASCRPPASSLKLNPVYVDSPLPSGECLPRHLVTPKGRRLSIGPSSADRNRASEFWNYYDMWVNCSLSCVILPLFPWLSPLPIFMWILGLNEFFVVKIHLKQGLRSNQELRTALEGCIASWDGRVALNYSFHEGKCWQSSCKCEFVSLLSWESISIEWC